MELEVDCYGIRFEIQVTHYEKVEPQGKWADSDWEAQGYEDLEYEIISVSYVDWQAVMSYNDLYQSVLKEVRKLS